MLVSQNVTNYSVNEEINELFISNTSESWAKVVENENSANEITEKPNEILQVIKFCKSDNLQWIFSYGFAGL